jgi:hypothetical protein
MLRFKPESNMLFDPSGEYVRASDVLAICHGCKDYGGGYRGNKEHYEIYQHGIQTVINAMNSAMKCDPSNTQSNATMNIGHRLMEELNGGE